MDDFQYDEISWSIEINRRLPTRGRSSLFFGHVADQKSICYERNSRVIWPTSDGCGSLITVYRCNAFGIRRNAGCRICGEQVIRSNQSILPGGLHFQSPLSYSKSLSLSLVLLYFVFSRRFLRFKENSFVKTETLESPKKILGEIYRYDATLAPLDH